jgi:hypothetical protein
MLVEVKAAVGILQLGKHAIFSVNSLEPVQRGYSCVQSTEGFTPTFVCYVLGLF